MNSIEYTSAAPHANPMATAPAGDTTSHPAVMPTSPASTPLRVNESEGLPYFHMVMNIVAVPAATADRFVVSMT